MGGEVPAAVLLLLDSVHSDLNSRQEGVLPPLLLGTLILSLASLAVVDLATSSHGFLHPELNGRQEGILQHNHHHFL